jgi:hypothetical protein
LAWASSTVIVADIVDPPFVQQDTLWPGIVQSSSSHP